MQGRGLSDTPEGKGGGKVTPVDRSTAEFQRKVEEVRELAEKLVEKPEDYYNLPPVVIQVVDGINGVDEIIAIFDTLGIDIAMPTNRPTTVTLPRQTTDMMERYQKWQLEIGNPLKTKNDIIIYLMKSQCPLFQDCNRFEKVSKRLDEKESG